ncbi:DUF839 domain-containing protein [Acinetobacter puyangensis]|uniref:Alkaline phosphatase n=1 Tax=Acinetobacter puyangensis TaxID=1096779 RepID=A0A240E3N6_9GAMM|nr:alkaline phosphatase PhoX [Acinetobacter puyangensis]SNX43378.1 hypothetical protein SAMN05421731_101414 [Acinetobacter puyangensis]
MTEQANHPSRRDILKWFAGVPFLPLGAMATASVLSGCNDDDNASDTPAKVVNFKSATFTAMDAPTLADAAAMATTTVASKLSVNWDDGSKTDYQLGYKEFFKTGAAVKKHPKQTNVSGDTIIAGGYFDVNGKAIIDPTTNKQWFSDCPDGSSLISFKDATGKDATDADKATLGVKGNPVFHVVQFEYTSKAYGELPSPIAILTLDQDSKTGHLDLVQYYNIDMSAAHGLWITCGASLSPWGTHLSSEEYEPDAFEQGIGGPSPKGIGKYYLNDESKANAYNYGHLPEITVNADGTGTVKKHYGLGRISRELIQVMPDNRTAIMGDDYTNGGLFMFVADKEKDLSAGTLYVAKYTSQLTDKIAGNIQWIKLGHATSDEIENFIKGGIQPADIMESLTEDPNDSSYTKIVLAKKSLWVKIKTGMEKAAAFLETHRYAAYKGASMAFTKMEGTSLNIKDKVAYSALANIQDSMVEGKDGYIAEHNVKFPQIKAGGILAHQLTSGLKDSEGNLINSEWAPSQSETLLVGTDIKVAQDPNGVGNTADPDNIASPDNLKFSETLRTLFIGEDSGNHVNNFLWAYNLDTKELTRLLSTPAGAESTGLHAVDSVNGWTYIMSNFQHPGEFTSGTTDAVKTALAPLIKENFDDGNSAFVGYITADSIEVSLEEKKA